MTYAHGVPQLPVWIWLILGGVFIGVPAAVIAVAMLLRARASRSVYRHAGTVASAARAQARRVIGCGLAGLGVGVLVGVALVLDSRANLAALTCAGGYLIGLLLGEYSGQPPAQGPLRAASLLTRRPVDYVPRWAVAGAVLAAALTLAAPIAFALAPSIRYGNWHPFAGASFNLPGGRTSWPVWPGTVATAVLALVVLLVGAAGLRRVAARPRLAGDGEQAASTEHAASGSHAVDEVMRRQAGRAILGAVLGLELIVLAAILIAGSEGLAVPVPAVAPGAYLGSRVMVFAGLSCALAGAAAWLVLSGWTRNRRLAQPGLDGSAVTPGS